MNILTKGPFIKIKKKVTSGADELSAVLARVVKERGEVEKEYAKNIRKIDTKYTNKIENKRLNEVETSYKKALK